MAIERLFTLSGMYLAAVPRFQRLTTTPWDHQDTIPISIACHLPEADEGRCDGDSPRAIIAAFTLV